MYCHKCGATNDDNAYKCVQCGENLQQAADAPVVRNVPNYLVQAILVTLFCCLPFGIVSIVFAAQVNGRLFAGDLAGAMELSRKAKLWAWVAFGVGLGGIVLYFGFVALFAAIGMAQN